MVGSAVGALNLVKNGSGVFHLNEGGVPWGGGRSTHSEFSEFAIWNKVLSPQERATLASFPRANINNAPWNSGLIMGWHLDSTTDFSTYGGASNTGTLYGAVTQGTL